MIEKIERKNTIRKYVMIIIAIIIGLTYFGMATSRCFDTNYYGGAGTEYDQRKRNYENNKEAIRRDKEYGDYNGWYY